MKKIEININVKAWSILLATLFFTYQYIGFGIEKKESIELPYCDYEMFMFALASWAVSFAIFSPFGFSDSKWVKPISICFICLISYWTGELCGVAHSHFSYWSIIELLLVVGAVIQRERIKWFLESKNKPILYFICGLILIWR